MKMNVKDTLARFDSNSIFGGDKGVWMVLFLLSVISIIEVYSASSNMTYKSGEFWAPALGHLMHILMGWGAAILVCRIPCSAFKAIPVLGLPLVVLLLLYAMVAGERVNGASRWVGGFQPSEIAKGVLVVTTALILSVCYDKARERVTPRGMKLCLGFAAVICALILPENFSTAGLTFIVVLTMMFVGRADWRWLGAIFGTGALAAAMFFLVLKTAPMDTLQSASNVPGLHRLPTWASRMRTNESTANPDSLDLSKNIQVVHAKIAVATCGVLGRGPGNSVERDFLPQAYADFIFAIIIEELGLGGGILVVLLYLILLFKAGVIASRCERRFPALLCMGLAILIVVQAMVNICVCVGLLPVTGQQLPLVSRGGTGIIFNCIYIGIILSVSRNARRSTLLLPAQAATTDVNIQQDNEDNN